MKLVLSFLKWKVTFRFDCLESIAKTIDVEDGKYEDDGMPVELYSIIRSKDFEYIGCMDKSSREWILEYEKYYMNKSNLYLFHEICRNEENSTYSTRKVFEADK